MKIDNFALTMWQACPAKYDLRMNQGWTSRRRTGALGFGSVLHYGLAEWYKTGSLEKALLAMNEQWPDNMPVDDFRTKEKCITTMIEYTKMYPGESFKIVGAPANPVIEVPFTLDTGMYLPCPNCGFPEQISETHEFGRFSSVCKVCSGEREPLEYGGIYDMLVEFGGQHFVVDHKSTSMLGRPSYFNQFKPNNQMTGYIWAANLLMGHKNFSLSRLTVSGAIINAIGIYEVGKTKFEREITSRSPAEVTEWLNNLYVECCAIQEHKLSGEWPMRTGSCAMYGLCEYHSVHSLGNANERRKRLETDYVQEHWDYEMRDG